MPKAEMNQTQMANAVPALWHSLTDAERALLTEQAVWKEYRKNEAIHTEGEDPRFLMCLIDGKVKICKEGMGKKPAIVRIVREGEYFGYRAFFAKEKYKTSALAFEESCVCLIPMEIIQRIMRENAMLAMFFVTHLSKDLGFADERTINLTQKHIRGRLAEALLALKNTYGMEEDNCTLNIYLSREDLACLSNMTTSNAIRTLSLFATEKLIIIDGRKIKLINQEALKKISSLG